MSMVQEFLELRPDQLKLLRRSTDGQLVSDMLEAMVEDDFVPGPEHPLSQIDVDKAWHAIHFVLTGSSKEVRGPAGIMLGGSPLDEEVGYGPVRYLDARSVRKAAKVLKSISASEFRSKVSLKRLAAAKIYPEIWDESDSGLVDYVAGSYEHFREWLLGVAERKNTILLILT